ncbi:Nucleoside diphosphate kinase [Methanimicrococcus hongohii]|uniref:Nucleoside diphosphate kinase n=1 Tax=Methanimicrococcus hongohii TaxID=3028295 RepID=A0AA96V119_9EURY|nr:nucleoside-diphosphate kinase [Methanimicrococcus sp. Hf6]WNY24446.1 Nucleoside diphosphate kinase [Methanimicrococcus sp. Hf6]
MERTYVMVKPDGVARGLMGEVLGRIEKKGLKIVGMKFAVMEEAKAKEHYAEHAERPFFAGLVEFITSAPSLSLVVEGNDSIKIMRAINGATKPAEAAPGTIRGDFAVDTGRNLVHASDSTEAAEREIKIHFGDAALLTYKRCDDDCLYE